jgi:hypothetical protein
MASSENKPTGFTVVDRRQFTETGEARPAATAGAPAEAAPATTQAEVATAGPAASIGMPAVDFPTFLLSLGSSVLLHLGLIDSEDGESTEPGKANAATRQPPDLAMAKHTLDILAMLQEKTRGNLSKDEQDLLESLLYDLRLRFVTVARGA